MLFSKDELYECCAEIGIPEQNILLIKHSTLRDDPNLRHGVQNDSEIFKNTSKYVPSKKSVFFGRGLFLSALFFKDLNAWIKMAGGASKWDSTAPCGCPEYRYGHHVWPVRSFRSQESYSALLRDGMLSYGGKNLFFIKGHQNKLC